jgi:hypothetical protein
MGTFHQGKHELHGITVVVDTHGPEIYIGRCEDLDERGIILLDADVHRQDDGGRSKEEYLERAARFGVFKKYDRLTLASEDVSSIRRLGDL